MLKLLSLVTALGCLLLCAEGKTRYDGFKVIQVIPTEPSHMSVLNELEADISLGLDFWHRGLLSSPTQISVPPSAYTEVSQRLQNAGMMVKVLKDNLQADIEEEIRGKYTSQYSRDSITDSFLTYSEASAWLKNIANLYPKLMRISSMGTTSGGRDILQISLSSTSSRAQSGKPVIWFESTTHAREWATLSTTLNLIDWLVRGYGSNQDATFILDTYDIEMNPIGNPDGYQETWDTDRMWRKNARNVGRWCYPYNGQSIGVDLNRNWDSEWSSVGSSNSKCSPVYHGPSALSEVESANFATAMRHTPLNRRKAFISLHSFSQMILTPYGSSTNKPVPNYPDILRVANAARDAMKAKFKVGKPGELLYNAGGGAYDYAKDILQFEYSYTYELHPASGGFDGFVLKPSEIIPVFEDFKASFVTMAQKML